jgi:hypothetical protein
MGNEVCHQRRRESAHHTEERAEYDSEADHDAN